MKKRILITGATGAVGTALANELTEHGHDVTAIVRPGSRRLDRLAQNPRLNSSLQPSGHPKAGRHAAGQAL